MARRCEVRRDEVEVHEAASPEPSVDRAPLQELPLEQFLGILKEEEEEAEGKPLASSSSAAIACSGSPALASSSSAVQVESGTGGIGSGQQRFALVAESAAHVWGAN